MERFTTLTSRTVVLPAANIDTDQIIPAQYLTYNPAIPAEYRMFGKYALSSVPPAQCGLPKGHIPFHSPGDEFVSPYRIIIGGKNFGCGSSREHAAWALTDYGFRAVVSTEIADIFRNNALKNGLLPVVVEESAADWLMAHPGVALTIDVARCTVALPDGRTGSFPLEAFARHCLLEGLDELGFLLARLPDIEAYERRA